MSKSNTRAVLGFALALASGAFIFAAPANSQTGLYVANGEIAGGSNSERAALSSAAQASSTTAQPDTVTPVRSASYRVSAHHVFADGRMHHADPDPFIMAQLERDCPQYNK